MLNWGLAPRLPARHLQELLHRLRRRGLHVGNLSTLARCDLRGRSAMVGTALAMTFAATWGEEEEEEKEEEEEEEKEEEEDCTLRGRSAM
eukprot:7460788-Pyramimonas_sp.AAC.1